jgi:RNA polymerase sigma-70 factor (ECF subfamily)
MSEQDSTRRDVTRLLHDWRDGNKGAVDQLLPLVHAELQRLAHIYMASERRGHTLQTTALVNEAYVKLVGADVDWQDRGHFFAVAARAMRRILVDHARARGSAKRGGDWERIPLDEALPVAADAQIDFVALDEALALLEKQDERKGRVVELHYFGGLTLPEIARLLDVSSSTVKGDLRFARAFLKNELNRSS